jgi:pyruvate dehydrogenase E1 component beta subunit
LHHVLGHYLPGLGVVAPCTAADVIGLLASSIRSDDPDIFFEHKRLLALKGELSPEGHAVPLGQAAIRRRGTHATVVAIGAMVWTALEAAERLSPDPPKV